MTYRAHTTLVLVLVGVLAGLVPAVGLTDERPTLPKFAELLAHTALQPARSYPHALQPRAEPLTEQCLLRRVSRVRLEPEGEALEGTQVSGDCWVIEGVTGGKGPIRFVTDTSDFVLAFYVDRSQLTPQLARRALVYAQPPENDALWGAQPQAELSPGPVDVDLAAYEGGAAWVSVSFGGWDVRLDGFVERAALDEVFVEQHYSPVEADAWIDADTKLRGPGGVTLATLSGASATLLRQGTEEHLVHVVGSRAQAIGRVPAAQTEISDVFGVGGLGMLGTGRGGGGIGGAPIVEIPAGTPAHLRPDGLLVGRAIANTAAFLLDQRDDWYLIEEHTPWGTVKLWLQIPPTPAAP